MCSRAKKKTPKRLDEGDQLERVFLVRGNLEEGEIAVVAMENGGRINQDEGRKVPFGCASRARSSGGGSEHNLWMEQFWPFFFREWGERLLQLSD